MKRTIKGLVVSVCSAMLLGLSTSALAYDTQIKYIIPTMKTEADVVKVKKVIMEATTDGVMEIEVYLADNEIRVLYDDDILDEEKKQIRIPLRRMGYNVDRYEFLLETRR